MDRDNQTVFVNTGPLKGKDLPGKVMNTGIPQPVDSFPTSPYADPFDVSSASASKLQNALNNAVQTDGQGSSGLMGNVLKMTFAIGDLTSGPPFPFGGYHDSEVDFIASEAKAAVTYAAFELRAMARRFIAKNNFVRQQDLFSVMDSVQTPKFLNSVPLINSAGNMMVGQRDARKPNYSALFTTTAASDGTVASIDFKSDFTNALTQMAVFSADFPEASTCIQAIGYSYLNGALSAGGFFSGGSGVWVGSDYSLGQSGWPTLRVVQSANDGMATITGTSHQMAKMFALVFTKTLIDKGASSAADNGAAGSCAQMANLLGRAAQELCVITSTSIPQSNFVINKVGFAFLGRTPGHGVVNSQVSVIKNVVATGRTYVIAWQNLVTSNEPCGISSDPNAAKVTKVITDAIRAYEN